MQTPADHLTVVHDRAKHEALRALAKELQARLQDDETDIPVIPLYIAELCSRLGEAFKGYVAPPDRTFLQSPHPITDLARTMAWVFRDAASSRQSCIDQAKRFHGIIQAVEWDDGWPTDRWLCCLYECCVAMELGLGEPHRTRWPAAVGASVAELLIHRHQTGYNWDGKSYRAWACQQLLRARHKARGIT